MLKVIFNHCIMCILEGLLLRLEEMIRFDLPAHQCNPDFHRVQAASEERCQKASEMSYRIVAPNACKRSAVRDKLQIEQPHFVADSGFGERLEVNRRIIVTMTC